MTDKKLVGIFSKKKPNETLKLKAKEEDAKLEKLSLEEKKEILIRKFLEETGISREECDEETLSSLSESLCTKEGIKKSYLNKDFKSVVNYFKTLKFKEKKKKILQSTEGISKSESEKIETEEEIEEDLTLYENIKVNEKIKIKLIITEIAHSEKEKNLRKILSPFADLFKVAPRFGMFHTALAIGPCK